MCPFDARNPLYAIIHESSYADGGATRWSAERVEPEDFRGDTQLLTGEHLFPWHFEDCAGLQPYREVASIVAEHGGPGSTTRRCSPRWTSRALRRSTPTTRSSTGSSRWRPPPCCPACAPWLTDEFLHNGIRSGGERVLDRLIGLARGTL